jgi:hypothetical protein
MLIKKYALLVALMMGAFGVTPVLAKQSFKRGAVKKSARVSARKKLWAKKYAPVDSHYGNLLGYAKIWQAGMPVNVKYRSNWTEGDKYLLGEKAAWPYSGHRLYSYGNRWNESSDRLVRSKVNAKYSGGLNHWKNQHSGQQEEREHIPFRDQ